VTGRTRRDLSKQMEHAAARPSSTSTVAVRGSAASKPRRPFALRAPRLIYEAGSDTFTGCL